MRPALSSPGVANRRLLGAVALLVVLAAYLGLAVKPALADHVDTPLASKTPASLDFGTQQTGTDSSSRTVQVRNEHNGCQLRFLGSCLQPRLVQISSVGLGGFDPGGFTITGNTCSGATLNQGTSCSISVRFDPAVAQMHSAVLTIVSNSNFTGGSQVPLSGQGVNPIASPNPGSLDFGNQVVSTTSASRPVTVTNTGVGTLTIGGASLGGANTGEFVLGSPALPASLPVGASMTFNVSFAPTITGIRRAELVINSNAAGGPLSVPLAGKGVFNTAPAITAVRPAPNARTKDRTPTISATIRDTQTELAKSNLRLFVDGRRITGFRYNQSTDRLAYTSRLLPLGRHAVKIVANDGQGLSKSKAWRFTIVW